MKRRLISAVLSLIMTASAVQPVFSGEEPVTADSIFSTTPKDMTPVEQDYSPGLGDRNDAISYTVAMGWMGSETGLSLYHTYEDGLEIQKKVANLTNGAHQVVFTLGQDILRWGSAPYLIEDPAYPMGDGTPGSGYAKYRKYVDDSYKNNADVAQILEPLLAGSKRDDYASEEEKIPLSCYTHDEAGNKKVGWSAGSESWYLLSLHNLYKTGYAQTAWQRMQDTWNFRTHIYYDAMIPVPEGLYNNPNLTTKYGGEITNTKMEWDAVQKEIMYSWENFALSSGQEYLHNKYKGLSCYFTLPYGVITDNDYLNTWGNSMMIARRGDDIQSIVWGSELNGNGDYQLYVDPNHRKWDELVTRLMEQNLQYLYMLERKPLSYTNNTEIYQVEFSGDLVSTFNRKTGNYTLIEGGDFIIADGGDRFIPQVGAGCKIYVYSRDGKTRSWKLPDTWAGVTHVDRYRLSKDTAPVKVDTIEVVDGRVSVDMSKGVPYIIVPKGDSSTPDTANFNDLAAGDTVGDYKLLSFGTDFKVYEASANGGFTSPSLYFDTSATETVTEIGIPAGAILHSFKIANKGGVGKVVLHSSNPMNPDVMIELPKKDQIYKLNTTWIYGETGPVTVMIVNDNGVENTLFDAFMYSETSNVKSCADGNHEYTHVYTAPICGADGRDSDVCRFCGHEINVTVLPAVEGEHNFADREVLLTATAHNTGRYAVTCLKCGYSIETEIPKTFDTQNHVFHHDFGNNYMQTDSIRPYDRSNGTVAFDVLPIDVTRRTKPAGPCYIGVWFGKDYTICAAYDFSQQKFVIGNGEMKFYTSVKKPLATKDFAWTKAEDGTYPLHRFAFNLKGNTATIYLDGEEMLSFTDPSFASTGDVLLMYTKGECLLDNIAVSDSDYDVKSDSGEVLTRVDFEKDTQSLEGWTLGGFITTDIRELDISGYYHADHIHKNVLIASHNATYFHGPYDEYECTLCYARTVTETGDALTGDVLVHVSAASPSCTETGNTEYWYDRDGNRFSDAAGKKATTLSAVTVSPVGHDLIYHPATEGSSATEGFIEYWSCSRCMKSFADKDGETEISLMKTEAVRKTEEAIAAIGTVKYDQQAGIKSDGIVGTFTDGGNNANYSVLEVGNPNSKLNADYTVEMLIRIRDVDKTTEIGGAPGAFFGLYCENFTVGYDFVTEKWGVSPISGLFASYPFQPSESGPVSVLDDGYFHKVVFECTKESVRVIVDGICVLNSRSLVREDYRYCIFYPRLCTVEFANYAFKYDGKWVDDHLSGKNIVSASTWTSKGSGYGTKVETFEGTLRTDSLKAIETAEALFAALSENEKLLVSNSADLTEAREIYEWLAVSPLYGDVTVDGKINLTDVSALLKYIAKWEVTIDETLADVNADGNITLTDVSSILKHIAKWDIILGWK